MVWRYNLWFFWFFFCWKVGTITFQKKVIFTCSNENSLKMMKNLFYFMLKAPFVHEIFTFLSWLFGYVENSLIRKLRLISKCTTSKNSQQIITIHILSNISGSKGNQTMKFGLLIEYNMRNISLEKSYTKCSGEGSPRSFCKKSKLSMFLDKGVKELSFLIFFL